MIITYYHCGLVTFGYGVTIQSPQSRPCLDCMIAQRQEHPIDAAPQFTPSPLDWYVRSLTWHRNYPWVVLVSEKLMVV